MDSQGQISEDMRISGRFRVVAVEKLEFDLLRSMKVKSDTTIVHTISDMYHDR